MLNEITFISLQKNKTHKYIAFHPTSPLLQHYTERVTKWKKEGRKKSNKVIFSLSVEEGEKKETRMWVEGKYFSQLMVGILCVFIIIMFHRLLVDK